MVNHEWIIKMLKKKICLVGAFAVGKTSLVRRYVHSIFSEKYHTTVGVKVDRKRVVVNDIPTELIIWDLHGEDEFQSVRTQYLRGASGCIFVADGTRAATLDVALNLHKRVEEAVGQVPSILAINKYDLKTQWEVDASLDKRMELEVFSVLHTSAKTGTSVECAFETLAAKMVGS
jgi:small GTP-binding protein